MVGNYPVVTLCGSTRFKEEFYAAELKRVYFHNYCFTK